MQIRVLATIYFVHLASPLDSLMSSVRAKILSKSNAIVLNYICYLLDVCEHNKCETVKEMQMKALMLNKTWGITYNNSECEILISKEIRRISFMNFHGVSRS